VPADRITLKLAPCAAATQNPRPPVSPACCAQIRAMGRNPKCLCAVMLSGVKPAVAVTIPKRCAIAKRPIGYNCGRKGLSQRFPLQIIHVTRLILLFSPCSIQAAMRSESDSTGRAPN
jgi:hypothetical protein